MDHTYYVSKQKGYIMFTKTQILEMCNNHVVPKYNSMPDSFPCFLKRINSKDKKENALYLKKRLPEFQKIISEVFDNQFAGQNNEVIAFLKRIAESENILHLKEHFSEQLLEDFADSMLTFLKRVKAFDKSITEESIWQAMRNYLIYAIIVNLEGEKQNCRDTILGYSLLYPYTDNYIDKSCRSRSDKDTYNTFIRNTLSGKKTDCRNAYEIKTKELLEMVLNYYSDDVSKQKDAANLLLIMLEAQENSIMQIRSDEDAKLTSDEILNISVFKGGVSVLIDYLFSVDYDTDVISEEKLYYYLCFGLILQLADDVEDLSSDKENQSQTLMSLWDRPSELEKSVNRLLHFTRHILAHCTPKNPELQTFLYENCLLVILIAIARNSSCFSKEYLKSIEPFLPCPLDFFRG